MNVMLRPQFGRASVNLSLSAAGEAEPKRDRAEIMAPTLEPGMSAILDTLPDNVTLNFICKGAPYYYALTGQKQIANDDMTQVQVVMRSGGRDYTHDEVKTHHAFLNPDGITKAAELRNVWCDVIARANKHLMGMLKDYQDDEDNRRKIY